MELCSFPRCCRLLCHLRPCWSGKQRPWLKVWTTVVTKMSVCDTDGGEVQKTISLTQGLDNMINVYKTDDGKNTGQLLSRCLCSTHSKAPFSSFHMASSVSSRLYNQLPNLRYKWLRTNDKHTASIIILKNHQGAVSIGRINNFLNTEEIDPTSVSR